MVRAQEILIKNQRNKQTVCEIFIYEPENIEEVPLGNLYITAELTCDHDSTHLISLIGSLIKREYYCSPHRVALESLEASLKKANQALKEFSNQGNLGWLGNFHFLCAVVIKEETIFIAQSGQARAYLCREGQLTNITPKTCPLHAKIGKNQLKQSSESPEAKIHPAKTFQNIISGKIEPTDKIIFATPGIFNLIQEKNLIHIFSLPRIEEISEQINKFAAGQKKLPPGSALVLEIVSDEQNVQYPPKNYITPPIDLSEIFG